MPLQWLPPRRSRHRRTRPRLTVRLAAAIATLGLGATMTACGSSGAQTTEDGRTVIRYQSSAGAVTIPEIAAELGYLDNIELKLVGETTGGPESLRALATDQVDIANAFQGAIAKVVSTGAPVKAVVASYGSVGEVKQSITVRDDGSVKSAKDLVGKKVALNTLGANWEAVLDTYLAQEGLTPAEIEKVTLVPLPANVLEASLREKQIDAAFLSGPALEIAQERPGLTVLATDLDVVGPYTGGSYAVHEKLLEENPEAAEELVAGIARAIEWTQTRSVEEVREFVIDFLTEQGRDDAVQTIKFWHGTGIPSAGGWLRDKDFSIWLDWLEASGEVDQGSVEIEDIYTNELNPYADEAAFIDGYEAAQGNGESEEK
ncbi:ABC transporter substrate-binding protein [Nocardioides daphniae]|uniref:ABC transporter substrate-binding protein n=1 Tax=Nocardioides daphniae TaxID=402297 RepID=A0A4P7U816_9ACTN|nr:ABC transporter substrate-binding protein [Nocardioides daphniae]QCC76230.1 ABC transporter substrate-binding protein [Nocardioides daphniae]GGD08803.1 ABC transporter substrate-binding protein [Nocardioides daphniae]